MSIYTAVMKQFLQFLLLFPGACAMQKKPSIHDLQNDSILRQLSMDLSPCAVRLVSLLRDGADSLTSILLSTGRMPRSNNTFPGLWGRGEGMYLRGCRSNTCQYRVCGTGLHYHRIPT